GDPPPITNHQPPARSAQTPGAKKPAAGDTFAAGFLSLFNERTFPPRNASGPLLRRNAALPECVRKTTFTASSQ
ncbi:MAG: hypothetical protein U1C75_08945, partial [Brevundimonas sp.]|nr:hypothetical protein [Brevundimonas sp.]